MTVDGVSEHLVRELLGCCALEDPDVPRGDALWVRIDEAWPEAFAAPAEPLALAPEAQVAARWALAADLEALAARAGVEPATTRSVPGDRAVAGARTGRVPIGGRGQEGCVTAAPSE